MAFKATEYSPDEAYAEIKRVSRRVDVLAKDAIAKLAGNVTSEDIIGWGYRLKDRDSQLSDILANTNVAELIAYAKAQEADALYDVQAEYNAMSAQIDAVMTWIQTNMPASGGFLLTHSFGATSLTPRTFDTVATADLLTEIQTLDNLII